MASLSLQSLSRAESEKENQSLWKPIEGLLTERQFLFFPGSLETHFLKNSNEIFKITKLMLWQEIGKP